MKADGVVEQLGRGHEQALGKQKKGPPLISSAMKADGVAEQLECGHEQALGKQKDRLPLSS
jgi:hypothetical protein